MSVLDTGAAQKKSLLAQARASLAARAAWGPLEVGFWLIALASIFLLPSKHLILTEIAILGLFALSLDLLLGYAGIVSLGHAAYFGFGAYVAGILAKYGIVKEPVLALFVSGLAASGLGFVTSFLVLRGSDLTRLMVTLGVALVLREIANQLEITGGADGLQGIVMEPVLGRFAFDIFGLTGYVYSLTVLFLLFLLARRIVNSPFGLSLRSVKENPLRASAIGIYRFWRDLGYAVGALISGIIADLLGMRAAIHVVAFLTLLSGLQVAFRMRETLVGQSTKEPDSVPSPAARL